jgi:hypothetical protein
MAGRPDAEPFELADDRRGLALTVAAVVVHHDVGAVFGECLGEQPPEGSRSLQ